MATWTEKEVAVRSLESGGKVDPEDLIEAARDESHPCHGDFTWDVGAAALERWRDQARSIIRKCKFEVIVDDVTTSVVRYVESTDNDPVFVSLPKIRGVAKTSAVMQRELQMLHGNACRVRWLFRNGFRTAFTDDVHSEIVVEIRRRGALNFEVGILTALLEVLGEQIG